MARRKRFARRASSSFKRVRRSRSRSSGSSTNMIAYGVYGAARGKVAGLVRGTIGGSLGGLGNVSDELLMLGTAWAVKKFAPGWSKYANAALNVEAFNIGVQIGNGGFGALLGNGSSGGMSIAV